MFNDINYTSQENTEWDAASATCVGKDDAASQFCSYTNYPRAGEKIKVCFEGRSYFSDEVFVNLFDMYLDSDIGDSEILFNGDRDVEVGIKSVSDNDLYRGTAPSRALEADGNLTDGYATYCSDWLELPSDIVGSNTWDIQGRATLDSHLYSLRDDINWDWESDEFPIFGLFQSEPDWDLHLFEPIHYRMPETWTKISSNQYQFNMNISALGNGAKLFTFGEHLPIRLLDENAPLERIVNVTVTHANGSLTQYTTFLSTQFNEVIIFIEEVNTSTGDNNLTLTANTFDFANRSAVALEDIAGKTGTFKLSVDCPNEAIIGSPMKCSITGQIEELQLVQKEVDFTCYITDGVNRYSSINFNQMVTRNGTFTEREFLVPNSFAGDTQSTLQCHADYYNLGSRRDSFSDTFTTRIASKGSAGASVGGDTGEPKEPIEAIKQGFKELSSGLVAGIDKIRERISNLSTGVLIFWISIVGIVLFYIINWIRVVKDEEENLEDDMHDMQISTRT